MTDNILDAVVHHFVSDRYRLFWITGVVIFHRDELIAFNTAFRIDIGNCLLRTGKFWSPYCATGPDIAPTTATLMSSANAIWLNDRAIHPANNVLPFIFILIIPIILVVTCVVVLLFSTLFRLLASYPCFSSILC